MRSVCGVLNTQLCTGSTITEAPASEMNGSPVSSTSLTTAIVSPVVVPPISASTWSCSIRRLTTVTASLAFMPVSYITSSSG